MKVNEGKWSQVWRVAEIENEVCVQENNTTGPRNKSGRDDYRVKMRMIKRIQREKQPQAFWLTSVRHRALHGANSVTCSERERERAGWGGGKVEKGSQAGIEAELADMSHITSGACGL